MSSMHICETCNGSGVYAICKQCRGSSDSPEATTGEVKDWERLESGRRKLDPKLLSWGQTYLRKRKKRRKKSRRRSRPRRLLILAVASWSARIISRIHGSKFFTFFEWSFRVVECHWRSYVLILIVCTIAKHALGVGSWLVLRQESGMQCIPVGRGSRWYTGAEIRVMFRGFKLEINCSLLSICLDLSLWYLTEH